MENHEITRKAVLDLIKNLRTVKRQITILRSMEMPLSEKERIMNAIKSVEEDMKLFKI